MPDKPPTSLHDMALPPLLPPTSHADVPPPAEPPPPEISAGLLMDHILHDPSHPQSPTNPFEFPFTLDTTPPNNSPSMHGWSIVRTLALPDFPLVMDSVARVIGSPRVFGLRHDSSSYVCVWKTSTSLLDAGANICLTGDLQLLVDVIKIPPLPISVAITGDAPSLDDCCTHRGYLPLQLSDGSTHWQLCFYCKNTVETIISPQAILESRNVLARWDSRTVAPSKFVSTARMDYSPCVWT